MKKALMLLYGVLAYLVFLLTIAYSAAFFGNLFVARTIDAAAAVPLGEAMLVDLALLVLFALQHSGMARKSFKRWLHARLHRCLERSTYVWASSVALLIVMAFWQPMGGVVWSIEGDIGSALILVVYFAGWGLMLFATFLMNHFELFGLSQVWAACAGGTPEPPALRTPGMYRHVRHPIYLGWLLVVWASPLMTMAHLVFAAGMTIYVLIGIQFEERDLAAELPDYPQYKRKVPMLIPSWRRRLLQEPD